MKINFKEIPKFVINLQRRQDRLNEVQKEFDYMGWVFERFEAIDTNSYIGCALSHKELAKEILEKNYQYVMVFEDDTFFMPYTKKILPEIENELNQIEWDFFHFGPALHRPVQKFSENLLDLTNLPPKNKNIHRGIFGTSGFILTPKACEYILKWDTNQILQNSHRQIPIDEFFYQGMYPNIKSYCAKYPLSVQRPGYSDINGTVDSNHYLMTYNWNVYAPDKLDMIYLDYNNCLKLRNEN